MRDRASDLRAIADGRLMLNVRNGVTVSRSMLAMIADEFEAMSTALAAKDAELARRDMQLEASAKVALDLSAQLAEARKALGEIEQEARSLPLHTSAVTWEHVLTSKLAVVRDAARRALTGGQEE